jgi:hypothetical protein
MLGQERSRAIRVYKFVKRISPIVEILTEASRGAVQRLHSLYSFYGVVKYLKVGQYDIDGEPLRMLQVASLHIVRYVSYADS